MSERNQLIFEFFKQFASLESALRISNYVDINDDATIKWHELKDKLKQKNFKFTKELEELGIVKNPPKKLKFSKEKGKIVWEDDFDSTEHGLAVDSLLRIRNNLFHGSKKFGDSSESERNAQLVSGALIMLEEVVKSLDVGKVHQDIIDYWN